MRTRVGVLTVAAMAATPLAAAPQTAREQAVQDGVRGAHRGGRAVADGVAGALEDPRSVLDGVAGALERALDEAGVDALPRLSSLPARAYTVPGVGAVFTLAPRRLPGRRITVTARADGLAEAATRLERALRGVHDEHVRAELARTLEALRAMETLVVSAVPVPEPPLPPRPRRVSDEAREVEREVRRLHEQAEVMRREAERAWREAELAIRRGMALPVVPVPADPPAAPAPPAPPPVPAAPVAPAAPAPPAPPLPLLLWEEAAPDPESEQELVTRVKTAVARAISAAGQLAVAEGESVVVAVDFLPRRALWMASRPQRTVVLRLSGRDLAAGRQGRLDADELASRVEVAVY